MLHTMENGGDMNNKHWPWRLQLVENFFSELSFAQAVPPPKFQHSDEKEFSDSQPFAFSLGTRTRSLSLVTWDVFSSITRHKSHGWKESNLVSRDSRELLTLRFGHRR